MKKSKANKPLRSCIGCQRSDEKSSFIRLVRANDGEIRPDLRQQAPGRGIYLCPNTDCLQKACKRKSFARAYKAPCLVSETELFETICEGLKASCLKNLGLLRRCGHCVVGHDRVLEALENQGVKAIWLAEDLAKRSSDSIKKVTGEYPVFLLCKKDEMGAAMGLLGTGIVALLKGRMTSGIVDDLKKYSGFYPGAYLKVAADAKECVNG